MILTIIKKEGKGRNIYILITWRKPCGEEKTQKVWIHGKDLRFSYTQ